MAIHSSLLAWRVPWTEEPGGCSPQGLKESDWTGETEHTHISSSWGSGLQFPLHSQANGSERQYRKWVRTGTLEPKGLSLSSCSLDYKSYNLGNHCLTQFPNLLVEIMIILIYKLRIKDICNCGSDNKESACNVGDPVSISGLGRSRGERNGNTLQYSYLENSTDRGAWWTMVCRVTKSWTRLSN